MTNTEYIDGGAGRIAVHHFGGSGDTTLLICHATGFLGQAYRALAYELTNDAQVVALDFRAHGDSDAPSDDDGFAWTEMTDDLLRVVDHLEAPTLHGFGHSMGGAAVLGAERKRPGTFRSLMVFEPIVPPKPISDGNSPIVRSALTRLRTFPSYAEALQRYSSKPPLGLFRADVLSDYVRYGFAETDEGVTLKCTPENEANTYSKAGSISLNEMADIARDVVVGQSGDGQLPAQLAAAIADTLPHGTLRHFPTITHFGPLQDPVVVANALREQLG